MRYKVVGVYKHEEVVNTESYSYERWRASWRGRDYKDEERAVIEYVQDFLNFQIIDDDGHGTLTASSLDWTVNKEVE